MQPPLGTLESEARISGPKSSHESGTVCLAPHCEVQGTRSQIWAGNWAPNPVPKIRPSSGPAGWDKACAPGVIRLLCQAKARVTVSCLNWRLCQARQCDLHCWVAVLLRFSGWWFPFAAISAPFCGTRYGSKACTIFAGWSWPFRVVFGIFCDADIDAGQSGGARTASPPRFA